MTEKMETLTIHNNNFTELPKLPTDLIEQILYRLPAKPLARFKCVSKSWNSLITSRHFILRHVTRSLSTSSNLHFARLGRSTLATLSLPEPGPITTIYLPFSTRAPDSDLIGSCHGILCISDHPNFLALFNPTTRTHIVVPTRSPKQKAESHWVDYGLGYDNVSGEFKVVRVDQHNGPGLVSRPREVRVYTETRPRWRKVEAEFPHYLAHPKGHGKFLHKSVHWMASSVAPKVYDVKLSMKFNGQKDTTFYKYVIVAFDMSSETFSEIELPFSNAWLKKKVFPKPMLVVLGEKLGVQMEYGDNDRYVELWMLSDYNVRTSWVKLYCFIPKQVCEDCIRVKPLAISENGLDVEVLMEYDTTEQACYFWYNATDGRVRDVDVDGDLPSLFEWRGGHACCYGAVVYVDSLITLNNTGLVHAVVPEDPTDNITDEINTNGVLPLHSFRAHSQDLLVPQPQLGRVVVPIVGFGKRLP